jgi:hypothetical protein
MTVVAASEVPIQTAGLAARRARGPGPAAPPFVASLSAGARGAGALEQPKVVQPPFSFQHASWCAMAHAPHTCTGTPGLMGVWQYGQVFPMAAWPVSVSVFKLVSFA